MIYNYIIKIKNSTTSAIKEYNLGSIINGANTVIKSPLCGKTYKSAAAEASFVLTGVRDGVLYSSVLQDILDARSNINAYDIEVIITDSNANTVFSGYLDDANFSITTSSLPESLSLTARDKSILLDQTARLEQYYEGKTRTELVSLLLQAVTDNSGVSCTLLSSDLTDNGTDSTVSNWVVTEDDNKTFRDKIDTILFEAPACVLWYDSANNGFRIKQLPTNGVLVADNTKTYYKGNLVIMDNILYRCIATSVVGVADRTKWEKVREVRYLNADKMTTSNGVYAKDGVLIKYPTIATRENQNVYSESINPSIEEDEDTGVEYVKGEEIDPDEFYPEAADQVATYQEYSDSNLDRAYNSEESSVRNEDISILYVKNAKLQTICSPETLEEYPTAIAKTGYPGHTVFYMRKAWVLLHNKSTTETVNLTGMGITGTAVYKSILNKMTLPEACTTPEEYETETLFENAGEDKIKQFASWLYNSKKYSCTTSSWTENGDRFGTTELPFSKLGDVVRIVHRVSDTESISIPHVVIQIDNEAFTTYGRVRKQKVTAISLNGYSVYDNVKLQAVHSSATADKQNTILTSKTYYGLSSSATVEPTEWTDDKASLSPSTTNKYIWSYTEYTYMNGNTRQSSKQVSEIYKDVKAESISVASESSYIVRNERSTGNRTYTFNAKVTGYSESKIRWFMNEQIATYKDESEIEHQTSGITCSWTLEDKSAESAVVRAVVLAEGYDDYDSEHAEECVIDYASVTLTAVDETSSRKVFDVTTTIPTSTTYTENEVTYNYISGDSMTVNVTAEDGTITSTIYVFNGTSWQILSQYFDGYESIMLDNLPSVFGDLDETVNHTVANQGGTLYDFFKQIIAEHISAVFYHVGKVIYGGDVDKNDSDDPADWTLGTGKGFIIRSDGSMEINQATFDTCNITGSTVIGGDATFQGKLYSDVIRTYDGDSSTADDTGVTISESDAVAWNKSQLISAMSSHQNAIYSGNGSIDGVVSSIAKLLYLTDTSITAQGATVVHENSTSRTIYSSSITIYTVSTTGTYHINAKTGKQYSGRGYFEKVHNSKEIRISSSGDSSTFYTDSSTHQTIWSFDVALESGDSILFCSGVQSNGFLWYDKITLNSRTFSELGFSVGLQYYNGSSWVQFSGFYTGAMSFSGTNQLSSSDTFSFSSNFDYCNPNIFINYKPNGLNISGMIKLQHITDAITYNGASYTPNFLNKISSTQAVLGFIGGTSITISSGNYYKLYGTIKGDGFEGGVEMKGQYPMEDDTYDVGTSKLRWSGGYFKTLTVDSLTSATKTSQGGVIVCSKEVNGTLSELKSTVAYSNGMMGSGSISDGPAGSAWYNFLYIPHRTGGKDSDDSDNYLYGTLFMTAMTDNSNKEIYMYHQKYGAWSSVITFTGA